MSFYLINHFVKNWVKKFVTEYTQNIQISTVLYFKLFEKRKFCIKTVNFILNSNAQEGEQKQKSLASQQGFFVSTALQGAKRPEGFDVRRRTALWQSGMMRLCITA